MRAYFLRHLQVFFYSLGQLVHAPFASLMTIAVIGITLALPSGLYVAIDNIQQLSAGWDGSAKISLFLKRDIGHEAAEKLSQTIHRIPAVERVEYISPARALAEFKRLSGFGEALDALDYNPLPPVLIVQPADGFDHPGKLEDLVEQLAHYAHVDLAQLDLEWVKRLHALLRIARRGVWILACLLGLAVVLIIGNTIRLAVLNRRDEIAVIRLVGGTNAFIRRPFVYTGLLQGFCGALVAWLLVSLSLSLLAAPVHELANLYASHFRTKNLGIQGTAILVALGAVLGWLGARVAVSRHLHDLDPT